MRLHLLGIPNHKHHTTQATYLAPWTSADSTNFLTFSTSSFESLTFTAAEFSSSLSTLLVPGIGIIYHQHHTQNAPSQANTPHTKPYKIHNLVRNNTKKHNDKYKRWGYIISLSQKPSQRQLSSRTPLLLRNLLQRINKLHVLMEILLREARGHFSEIIVREVVAGFYRPREEATAKRRVGYYCDVEFATGFEEGDARGFDVEGPGGVFYLHCGDWLLEKGM